MSTRTGNEQESEGMSDGSERENKTAAIRWLTRSYLVKRCADTLSPVRRCLRAIVALPARAMRNQNSFANSPISPTDGAQIATHFGRVTVNPVLASGGVHETQPSPSPGTLFYFTSPMLSFSRTLHLRAFSSPSYLLPIVVRRTHLYLKGH